MLSFFLAVTLLSFWHFCLLSFFLSSWCHVALFLGVTLLSSFFLSLCLFFWVLLDSTSTTHCFNLGRKGLRMRSRSDDWWLRHALYITQVRKSTHPQLACETTNKINHYHYSGSFDAASVHVLLLSLQASSSLP